MWSVELQVAKVLPAVVNEELLQFQGDGILLVLP